MSGFYVVLWSILSSFVFGIGLTKNKLWITLPAITSLIISIVAGIIWVVERPMGL